MQLKSCYHLKLSEVSQEIIFCSFLKRWENVFGSQGHSLSDGLDDVQRAEMKAYMELVNNMLLTAEVQTSHKTHT